MSLTTKLKPVLAALAFATLLSGCQPEPAKPAFQATDITGAAFARDFAMLDHNGVPRTLADFRGKVVAVFFGYTNCPDVCPTTLSDFAAALKTLEPDAEKVQVLFVTVDPARDTPEKLRQFVPAFNPTFLGLVGDEAATRVFASEFKVVYQKATGSLPGHEAHAPDEAGEHGDNYLVDHSAGTFVFDKNGKIRLLMAYGTKPEAMAADLKALLAEP